MNKKIDYRLLKLIVKKIKAVRNEILIFFLFILLSLVATFPLIFRMKHYLYQSGGDTLASVYSVWWLKYAHLNHMSPTLRSLIASPYGADFTHTIKFLLWDKALLFLSLLANEIFAHNFFLLISFFLSAVMVYYLVHHFTGNKVASMISGIIYAFCPYHFVHAEQHFTLANIQWMPFYALTIFKLDEERSYKSALLCAFAFSLVFLSDYYYGYFMTIFTGAFILWRMWYGLRNRRLSGYQVTRLLGEKKDRSPIIYPVRGRSLSNGADHRSPLKTVKVVLVAVVVALAIILPAIYPILKNIFRPETGAIASLGYERAFSGLFTYSAQFFHYFLSSGTNPFIGGFTRNFIKVYHPVEQTLYLGWIGIVLSFVAIRQWRRKNKEQRLQATGCKPQAIEQSSNQAIKYPVSSIQDQGSRIQKAVSFFLFAGIVALIFSHAPWTDIGSFRIFFPSYLMYKIAPMFRCYARFGILVMLSVSVLAGIGLASILQKIKTPKKRGILVAIVVLLVCIEFAPILPASMVNAINSPPVYEWLSEQPGDFIIAEYPLESDSEYFFWQRVHQKKLVNGAVPGTYADKIRKEIVDILNPKTSGILSYLGAKYVIFHPEKYAKSDEVEIIGDIPDIKRQHGLRLVKTFSEARVYEVIALPIKPID